MAAHLTVGWIWPAAQFRFERTEDGWQELRDRQVRPVHQRRVGGFPVFRVDEEWLFTVLAGPIDGLPARTN